MSRFIRPRSTSKSKLQLWQERLQQFRRRSQTIQEFCDSVGCTRPTFHYWKNKIEALSPLPRPVKPAPVKPVAPSAFVPVVLSGGVAKSIVVRLLNGTRVVVPTDALAALKIILQHAQQVAHD